MFERIATPSSSTARLFATTSWLLLIPVWALLACTRASAGIEPLGYLAGMTVLQVSYALVAAVIATYGWARLRNSCAPVVAACLASVVGSLLGSPGVGFFVFHLFGL